MRTSLKRSAAVVGAGVLALGVSGVAFAFWTTSGSGSGTAVSDTLVALKVNQTAVPVDLGPGAGKKPLSGTFDNPNTSAVSVTNLTPTVVTGKDGCLASDYQVTDVVIVDGTLDPSSTANGSWTANIEFINDPNRNQDLCQGVTVTINYAVAQAA